MHKRQQGLLTNAVPLVVSYAVGYFRWTQLTPMILAWGFLLLTVLLLGLLNFQEQSIELGIRWSQITAKVPGLNEKLIELYEAFFNSGTKDGAGGIQWKDGQITAGIFKLWGYLSLFLLLLDIVYRYIFKRDAAVKPASLPRKLVICAMAITAVVAILLANYYFGNVMKNGDDPRLYFVGAGVLVWLISAYSLTVSHLLGRLSEKIMQAKS